MVYVNWGCVPFAPNWIHALVSVIAADAGRVLSENAEKSDLKILHILFYTILGYGDTMDDEVVNNAECSSGEITLQRVISPHGPRACSVDHNPPVCRPAGGARIHGVAGPAYACGAMYAYVSQFLNLKLTNSKVKQLLRTNVCSQEVTRVASTSMTARMT